MQIPRLLQKTIRLLLTIIILIAALFALASIWQHYMHDPWTRDGRVRADVVQLGTDVSGIVDNVFVKDNQLVKKGDTLFTVDKARYRLAVAEAKANLNQLEQQRAEAAAANNRRQQMGNYVSQENRDNARYTLASIQAQVERARVAIEQAELNLSRATIKAPVDGHITNLLLRPGQYVNIGANALTLVDSNSFYVLGYFEETKLDSISLNTPVRIQLLADHEPLWGHVDSYARGITDSSLTSQNNGLASVNASFDWVRLSQRIPVRIAIDEVPENTKLAAGLTATLYLEPDAAKDPKERDKPSRLARWWENIIAL